MALFSKFKKSGKGEKKLAIFVGYWGEKPSAPIALKIWEQGFPTIIPQLLKASKENKDIAPEDTVMIPPEKWFDKDLKDSAYPTRMREAGSKMLAYLDANFSRGIEVSSDGIVRKPIVGGLGMHLGAMIDSGKRIPLMYFLIPTQYNPPYSDQYMLYQNEEGDMFTDLGLMELFFEKKD